MTPRPVSHLSTPLLFLVRLARRTAIRRAAVAAVALAAVGPVIAQGPVPQGGQVLVTTTGGVQRGPDVAMDADGDYVVVWHDPALDGFYSGVFAQRYAASGAPRGGEFGVNTVTSGSERDPSVAMDADGDFVVAWSRDVSGDEDVYVQRFGANGVMRGPEIRANTHTSNDQDHPSVAMDADGDFVVAWTSYFQDGAYDGVHAQRFTAAGARIGVEFQVNSYTRGIQHDPDVAMDADGDFVVAWTSGPHPWDPGYPGQDGVLPGLYIQRYAPNGAPLGGEFRADGALTRGHSGGRVAMDADGDFVVAWTSGDPTGFSVCAERYTADGVVVGVSEFRSSTNATGYNSARSVAMDADGDFVVMWESPDESSTGVYARSFSAAGVARGDDFRVNTTTVNRQNRGAVAMDSDGDFVVVWESLEQPDQPVPVYDVFAQRYTAGSVAAEPAPTGGFSVAIVPNPVGVSGGRVRYETPEPGLVRVVVTDVLGREVAVLVDGERMAGAHEASFDTGRLAPGVYVVRLSAGAETAVQRVTVAR